ncbi:MAG: hypothetical protein JWM93_2890 [Frankiales bacterium]|nr:hypothetical protein [Frankiales bacterium]
MSSPRPIRRRVLRLGVLALVVSLAAVAGTSGGASAATVTPHFGPVIDSVAYEPQRLCDPHAKPGVLAFRAFAERNFGAGDLGITRSCHAGGTSEHKEGRAWDAAYNYYNPTQRARAERLIAWLLAPDSYGNQAANAKRLGIMYIIWHKHIWAPYDLESGWRAYSGPDPHTSHIHISFTWDGAMKRTTWFSTATSFLDPYEQWDGGNFVDPAEDSLDPILTVTPVDEPSQAPAVSVPEKNVHKVFDEVHGAVISAVHYTR